jgi:hypothetical protein
LTVRYANQLPSQIETQIVSLKHEKPHWGAREIRYIDLQQKTLQPLDNPFGARLLPVS